MQNLITEKSNVQHVKSFVVTFAAVLFALPVAATLMPTNTPAGATATPQSSHTLGASSATCAVPTHENSTTSTGTTSAGTSAAHKVAHHAGSKTVNKHYTSHHTTYNSGANSQIDDAVIGVSTAADDVVDVTTGDILSNNLNGNDVSLLNNNDVVDDVNVLSGNTNKVNTGIDSVLGGLVDL